MSESSRRRLAVVSGGGSGIGRAIALLLAAGGDDVIVIGRRPESLAATVELAGSASGRISPLVADLTEPAEVAAAATGITSAGRQVDVLVNNAGGNLAPVPAPDLAGLRRDWLANVTGNVLPVVLLTEALLPAVGRPGGRIVTISSVAALRGPATYGGAKAALHPWSAELAARLAPDGVTANVVAPGYVTGTGFYEGRMSQDFHIGRAGQSPMRRGGTVEEIAAAVGYLTGPAAGFITGQVIHINGGAQPGRG
jgi:3-oxoacyl-[acyl-carrier protein] reductase